jgi:hypothetical protein
VSPCPPEGPRRRSLDQEGEVLPSLGTDSREVRPSCAPGANDSSLRGIKPSHPVRVALCGSSELPITSRTTREPRREPEMRQGPPASGQDPP